MPTNQKNLRRSAAHFQSAGSTEIEKSRRQSLKEITKTISKAKKRQISTKTVRRALYEENLRSCVPLKKPTIFGKFDLCGQWKEGVAD